MFEVSVAHASCGIGPNGLEYVLNGHVFVLKAARCDRTAVQQQPWNIQTGQGQGPGGNGLVTAYDDDHGVKHIAPTDQLNRVGNDFAADEGGFHALRPHGDGVADGDGVDFHGRTAGLPHALLDLVGQPALIEVARHGLNPGVCHTDQRLGQIVIRKADSLEHGARPGAVAALGNDVAGVFGIECHSSLLDGKAVTFSFCSIVLSDDSAQACPPAFTLDSRESSCSLWTTLGR